ncbi:MAG: DUF4214 domain-containing protein [Actinomycetota bacterium]
MSAWQLLFRRRRPRWAPARGLLAVATVTALAAGVTPAYAADPSPQPPRGRLVAPHDAPSAGARAGGLAAATITDLQVSAVNALSAVPSGSVWTYQVQVTNTGSTSYPSLKLGVYQEWPGDIPATAVSYQVARDGGPTTTVPLTATFYGLYHVTVLTGATAAFSLVPGGRTTFAVTITPGTSASFGRIYLDEVVTNGPDSTLPKARFGFRWVEDFTSEAFVNQAYVDFLNRSPDRDGLTYWARQVRGGLPRGNLAYHLARQPEYLIKLVWGYYEATLGRPGDDEGTLYWARLLLYGKLTEAQVAAYFYASDEYYRTAGSDPVWVEKLYRQILGRPSDPGGRDFWVGVTRERGRHVVAYHFYQSLESRQARVRALYTKLLNRAADPGGLNHWSQVILDRGDVALAAFLAGSDEYLAVAQDLRA